MSFIASIGMSILVSVSKGLRAQRRQMVLLNPLPDVEKCGSTTARLQDILPIAHSEEDAQRLLASA